MVYLSCIAATQYLVASTWYLVPWMGIQLQFVAFCVNHSVPGYQFIILPGISEDPSPDAQVCIMLEVTTTAGKRAMAIIAMTNVGAGRELQFLRFG